MIQVKYFKQFDLQYNIQPFRFHFIPIDDDLSPVTATQFTTPLTSMTTRNANEDTSSSSEDEASQPKTVNKPLLATKPADGEEKQDEATNSDVKSEKLEKSDSAIDDVIMSPIE